VQAAARLVWLVGQIGGGRHAKFVGRARCPGPVRARATVGHRPTRLSAVRGARRAACPAGPSDTRRKFVGKHMCLGRR
jgi:hypothetical protein